jgi:hypothetical protein
MAKIIEDDETAQGHPLAQDRAEQQVQPVRAIRQRSGVVLRYQAADRDARRGIEQGQNRLENSVAGIKALRLSQVSQPDADAR